MLQNIRRVADVWMDEYKQFLIMRMPNLKYADPGDLSQRMAVRKRLKCKSFKWFMTKIAFDLEEYYPLVEPEPLAKGEVGLLASCYYCRYFCRCCCLVLLVLVVVVVLLLLLRRLLFRLLIIISLYFKIKLGEGILGVLTENSFHTCRAYLIIQFP